MQGNNQNAEQHSKRLFAGICLALVPTGASFAMISNVLGQLKQEFILTNSEVGFITGISVGGMAISLLVLGPLLEAYGLKRGTILAFIGHLVGLTCIIAASGFTDPSNVGIGVSLLMVGSVALACGNGMIEVVGNPLTAALFPENKATKLNFFHGSFPLAIAAASLLGFGLNKLSGVANGIFYHWTFQIGIVYIPILVYGAMVLPLKFPRTENAEAGLPVGEMFRYTLSKPTMYFILILMAIAISLELGTNRWIPDIFSQNIGIQSIGILLLAWISIVMFLLRFFASHYLIQRFSPPGLLAIVALSTSIGLVLFSMAGGNVIQATLISFLAATFFGIGVAFFFPTIVGIVSERLPKTGSLGIVLTCGVGLGAAGFIGQPAIGAIGDYQLAGYLNSNRANRTIALLETVDQTFAKYIKKAEAATPQELAKLGYRKADLRVAQEKAQEAVNDYEEKGEIVGNTTPQALRAITEAASGKGGEQAGKLLDKQNPAPVKELRQFAGQGPGQAAAVAAGILGPAEGYAGQGALKWISWVPLILVISFGGMYLNDKRRGGYKAERLTGGSGASEEAHTDSTPGH